MQTALSFAAGATFSRRPAMLALPSRKPLTTVNPARMDVNSTFELRDPVDKGESQDWEEASEEVDRGAD